MKKLDMTWVAMARPRSGPPARVPAATATAVRMTVKTACITVFIFSFSSSPISPFSTMLSTIAFSIESIRLPSRPKAFPSVGLFSVCITSMVTPPTSSAAPRAPPTPVATRIAPAMIMAAAAIQPKISPASPLFLAFSASSRASCSLSSRSLARSVFWSLMSFACSAPVLSSVSWIAFFSAFTMATRSAPSGIIGIDMPSAAAPPVGNGTNSPGDICVGGRLSPGIFGRML